MGYSVKTLLPNLLDDSQIYVYNFKDPAKKDLPYIVYR